MDLILTGAEIRDAPFRAKLGDALAVSSGCIAALGGAEALLMRRIRGTRVVRLRGGTLLPGFVDAHLHFRALVRRRASEDCGAVSGAAELLRRIERAASRGQGWIFAHGLEHRRAGFGPLPGLSEWDRVTDGRPLWLRHRSGHLSLLNSAALGALGWVRTDPPVGTMERLAGEPTGIVHDAEVAIGEWLRERHPPAAPEAVAATARVLLRHGTTAFADLTPSNAALDREWWLTEHAAGRIPQAVSLWVAGGSLRGRAHPGLQDVVRLGGVKVMLHQRNGEWSPGVEALAEALGRAARWGWPVAVHTVESDALVHMLEALRIVREHPPHVAPALRLEHLNLIPPTLVGDVAKAGVAVCLQPGLFAANRDALRETVPREQWPWLFPVASLAGAARRLALGSDAPAAPERLLQHAAAACARGDGDGDGDGPLGQSELGAAEWNSSEHISPERALSAITGDAAHLAGLADLTGALRMGLRADAVYFTEGWDSLRAQLRKGKAPRPAGTLCGGAWYDWRNSDAG